MNLFQSRVSKWVRLCLGVEIATNKMERNYRFIEESVELVQALGCSKEDVLKMVEHVYSRDPGEPRQEIGGVMVTLAALCEANHFDMQWAGDDELFRIMKPEVMEKVRKKHFEKPIRAVEEA